MQELNSPEMMPGNKIVIRAIILDENDKIFLAKRVKEGSEQGRYALIGGKPEKGESTEEAIIREIGEETELNVVETSFFKSITDSASIPGESWEVHYFICRVTGTPKLKEDEIIEGRFFSSDELSDL